MNTPLTHEQAKKLCEQYQYIVGASLDGSSSTIEAVLVTPFDQLSKERFFSYYLILDERGLEAILKEYRGFLFDVLIIARTNGGDLIKEDLSNWLAANVDMQNFVCHLVPQSNKKQAFI